MKKGIEREFISKDEYGLVSGLSEAYGIGWSGKTGVERK